MYHIRPSRSEAALAAVYGAGAMARTEKLVLTTTSLRNVVLADAADAHYYEVWTPPWERHRTRVGRLEPRSRAFEPVAELLNGHALRPGPSGRGGGGAGKGRGKGKEEDPKSVVAVRMYGRGEFRAVDEFLHVEEGAVDGVRGGLGGAGEAKGKGRAAWGGKPDECVEGAWEGAESEPGPSSRRKGKESERERESGADERVQRGCEYEGGEGDV